MNIEVREMKTEELMETVEIYLECARNDYLHKPSSYLANLDPRAEAEECEEWLYHRSPNNRIFVANMGSAMAGYIAAGPNIDEPFNYEGEVTGFFVRQNYRNLGIGLKLLQETCRYLRSCGYIRVVIYNARPARSNGYYRMLGGQVVRQVMRRVDSLEILVDIFGWKITDLLEAVTLRLEKHGRLLA